MTGDREPTDASKAHNVMAALAVSYLLEGMTQEAALRAAEFIDDECSPSMHDTFGKAVAAFLRRLAPLMPKEPANAR